VAIFIVLVVIVGFFLARLAVPLLSPPPDTLGINDGSLAPCPSSPNCYASAGSGEAITVEGAMDDAHARIVNIINSMDRATIITNQPDYVHAEFRSLLWGFIDDTEFHFDRENNVIHYRSAARLGQGDMGVNKQRIERIVNAFRRAS